MRGMMLPVQFRHDGQIPQIDSIAFPFAGAPGIGIQQLDQSTGTIVLAVVYLNQNAQSVEWLARIYISVDSAPADQSVTAEWVTLTPLQAPTQDSSVIPMATSLDAAPVEPILVPHCCLLAGDFNNDGQVNISDLTDMVGYAFGVDILVPVCFDQIDVNSDSGFNIADITYLVAYIFMNGPAPMCGTTGG
jgi:hypothetical protein